MTPQQRLVAAALGHGASVEEALAVAEGLGPLLGARAGAAPALAAAHRAALARESFRDAAVRPVLAALCASAVPVLLLKGAALRRLVYRPGERPMSDVDVLVPPAWFGEAVAAAARAGATLVRFPDRAATMRRYHEQILALPGGHAIDLHCRLAAWPLFAEGDLLARARVDEDHLFVPAPADLLVSLAVHLAQDGLVGPLRAVVDGLLVLERLRPAPEEVAARARAFGARRAVGAYLGVLAGFGAGEEWARLGRRLRGLLAVPSLVSRSAAPGPWEVRARVAALIDNPVRGAVFAAWRTGLRVLDLYPGTRSG